MNNNPRHKAATTAKTNLEKKETPEPSYADLKAENASLKKRISELEGSEVLLRSILDNEPDYISLFSPEGVLRFVNRVPPGRGIRREDFVGKSIYDLLLPESHETVRTCIASVVQTGKPSSYESIGSGLSGQTAHYEVRLAPLFSQGQVKEILAIATDVTHRKHTENQLKESQEKLRLAISATGMGLWSFDPGEGRITWDESLYPLFGLTPQTAPLTHEGFLQLVHPEDRDLLRYVNRDLLSGRGPGALEFRILRPDGQVRWLLVIGKILFHEDGKAPQLLGGALDITERKQAQQRIEESEQRYRDLFEKSAIALWEEDISQHIALLSESKAKGVRDIRAYLAENPDFLARCMEGVKLLSVNEESIRLFGARSKEELMARWREVFTPESMPLFIESVALLLEGASAFYAEVAMQTLKQEHLNVLVSISFAEVLSSQKLLVSFTDITRRKQAEKKLEQLLSQEQASRRRVTFLSETSKALVHSLDIKITLDSLLRLTVPQMAELAFVDLLDAEGGFGPSHLMVAAACDPEQEALLCEMHKRYPRKETSPTWEALRTGQPVLLSAIRDDPSLDMIAHNEEHKAVIQTLWRRFSVTVPLIARGQKLGVLVLATNKEMYNFEDLTLIEELGRRAALAIDNARLYQEAQDAIRVRDEFLSIASHELKTPLTPMRLKLQHLLRLCQKDTALLPEQVRPKLESANQQLDRIHRLVEELLDISRITVGKLTLEPEPLDLSALLREILERFSEERKRYDCPLLLQVPPTLPGRWDRLRLEQVLTNLLSNALKYGSGKPVEIRLEEREGRAHLSVRDHGIGIEPGDQERIFGRFERAVSERHYGGFGLGLWITRQIVEAMGGSISVQSHPGQGSTFFVELPLS